MRRTVSMAISLVFVLSGRGLGEVELRTRLELSARDDALAQLFRRVTTLSLRDGRTLGALFGGLPEEDVRFRRIVAQRMRPLAVRRYGDGSIDVDVAIAGKELLLAVDQVRKISRRLERRLGGEPALRMPGETLFATGLAFPPPIVLSPTSNPTSRPAAGSQPSRAAPPGWRHLCPPSLELTIDAARQRALTNLFNDVRRIRIGSNHSVAGLLRLAPERINAFRATLAREAVYKIDLDPAQICAAHCDVPAQVVLDFLRPAVKREQLPDNVLSSTGYAAPPPSWSAGRDPLPDWYDQTRRAAGQAGTTLSKGAHHNPGRLAATLDAKYKLARIIDALSWPEGGRVRQRILSSPHLAADLTLYLAGARTLSVQEKPTGPVVTLEIPLRRLYHLLAGRP